MAQTSYSELARDLDIEVMGYAPGPLGAGQI